ncbi:PREDICTED: uncharacterized protein LOC104587063 isoform X1 [Nelumbo nucifera]|uniref:Uncharacterized protein LOC104587063 isoform X1 n=1 Tax=Nelumbo nucifera TaxID=4432 RepID=A0A1U7YRK1_NELNU|nr:PREDICTED: uncharacterized protein LOC104587063 isoform X1 [Nelumbo nucifera]
MERRTLYVWGVAIVCFVVLMIVTPAIPQNEEYHDFADQRDFFGIPNTLNVVSNFPFLVVGIVGLILCYHRNYFHFSTQGELWGWTIFFIGVTAVAFGSAYYHLKPNDARLVWDRLPMTVAFTSIISIFIIERIDDKKGTLSIIPLVLTGIISIFYWRYFDDLRPYALVQFVPCIVIPIMAILLPPMYTHSAYWLWAAAFYLLAKIEEAEDKPIYKWTSHVVSGHTLKHLFAAMVPLFLTLMLAKRRIAPERQSLLETWKISWKKVRQNGFKMENFTYSYSNVSTEESRSRTALPFRIPSSERQVATEWTARQTSEKVRWRQWDA